MCAQRVANGLKFRVVAMLLALMTALAVPLHAQRKSTTRGFVLGAHVFGASLDPEEGRTDGGGGFGFTAAYGFRNGLSIFLNADVAAISASEEGAHDYVLGLGDLGVRYTFGSLTARWRPFVAAAISGVSVHYENVVFGDFGRADVDISGPAFTAGGGIQLFLSPRVALEAALLGGGGNFDQVKVDNVTVDLSGDDKIKLSTGRLQLGLRYHFAGGAE